MPTVTLEEAQARLPELIEQLHAGGAVVITRDQQPVAVLTGTAPMGKPLRKLGTMKGSVLYMAPDFDAPLEEFKEYTE